MTEDQLAAVEGVAADVREALDGQYAMVAAAAVGSVVGQIALSDDMLDQFLAVIQANAVLRMSRDQTLH